MGWLTQDLAHGLGDTIHLRPADDDGRRQTEDILPQAAEEPPLLGRLVDPDPHLFGGGKLGFGLLVLDQLDSDHETQTADLTHVGVVAQSRLESVQQIAPLLGCLGGEVLSLDDVQVCQRHGATDGMGAVGVGRASRSPCHRP